jgi:hypothetical protein
MTDPTTAILDLIRERGPMMRREIGGRVPLIHVKTARLAHAMEDALASGALREVERREECGVCNGSELPTPCYSCRGYGPIPVTYIATPEQGAIMDALREGPMTWTEVRKRALSTGRRGVTARGALDAIDTLLAANWITRTEEQRECVRCGGEGDLPGRLKWGDTTRRFRKPCPACKDGKQTVVAYELAEIEPPANLESGADGR